MYPAPVKILNFSLRRTLVLQHINYQDIFIDFFAKNNGVCFSENWMGYNTSKYIGRQR